MRRMLVFACLCAVSAMQAQAQSGAAFDEVIGRYVAEGLRSNLALQSQTLEVERAQHALAIARARFMPEISLQARYTRAEGGREFVLPIGTALNPVYSTLNDMLAAQGQARRFRRVADGTIQFMREEEQETRLVAAPAALCTGDPRGGARAKRTARCEQLQSHGARAHVCGATSRSPISTG